MTEKQFVQKVLSAPGIKNSIVDWFPIETEETVNGFPDILGVNRATGKAYFVECKVATSTVSFRRSQVLWYALHKSYRVLCCVLVERADHVFHVYLFDKKYAKMGMKKEELPGIPVAYVLSGEMFTSKEDLLLKFSELLEEN